MNWLEDALRHGPLLGDGAMGTMLIEAGLSPGSSAELWNVDRPAVVEAVHRQYADAGSRYVTSNTFGGNPLALARHRLAGRANELNAAGVRLAREAAGDRAKVVASVGPFGGFLEPYGETTPAQLGGALRQQIQAFELAGADGIIIETMSDPTELGIAVRLAKERKDWPILATFTFQKAGDGFRTMMGTTVADAIAEAVDAGGDAVGANCGMDLSLADYLRLAVELVRVADGVPVILQPNAGTPVESGGVFTHGATPEDLARWTLEAIRAGVSIIGGCCGTTPAHIRSMALALSQGIPG